MTVLIVARHGNTFEAGERPRRVGRRTDLPLTAEGQAQARKLGRHLLEEGFQIHEAFAGTLRRTRETASLILDEMQINLSLQTSALFDEIDYGDDENKLETEVIARIGEDAIRRWEQEGIAPDGWDVSTQEIEQNWIRFADKISKEPDRTILAVTSNGTARFAPAITGDFASFKSRYSLKLATGAYGILRRGASGWAVEAWNIRP